MCAAELGMFTHQTFWLPKRGSSAAEYEDAHAVVATPHEVRCAVADGATEASFSGMWASALAEHYALTGAFRREALPALAAAWSAAVAAHTADKPLAWYAEEKLSHGSFAALVGLRADQRGTWQAVAAGDCCLLHIRLGKLVKAFPLETAAAFNNRPALLATLPAHSADPDVQTVAGTWKKGDRFFLMSDALAQFTLAYPQAIKELTALTAEAFAPLIERLRDDRLCRNDDVTFIRLHMRAAPSEP